ncbi:Uncharacterized protein conserved in bacteria [Cronobacter sakazakii]|nr:Uncharacterized protein conserved in bacteria [Cronobacter sakazakii]
MRNRVYVVDLSNATDLSTLDKTEPPEFDDAEKLNARGVKLATKQLAVDLRELGWQQEKAEGLALIDPQTLAVINDNDFGLQSELLEPQGDKKEMDDYNVDGQGHLTLDGKRLPAKSALSRWENPPRRMNCG